MLPQGGKVAANCRMVHDLIMFEVRAIRVQGKRGTITAACNPLPGDKAFPSAKDADAVTQ